MEKAIESIYDIGWNPRVLIESSAGTGKTYTLTAIYVRLLIEKKLKPDQILVMTFTKKATGDLKERIFRRLKQCLHALEYDHSETKEPFLDEFIQKVTDKTTAVQRLRHALENFDDSQIYTIHGFCQKVLKEEALLAGTPFEFDVVQQDNLLTQAVEDFWRNFISRYNETESGRYYISKLLDIANSPSKLKDELEVVFSKPDSRLEGEGVPNPLDYIDKVLTVRKRIAELWENDKENLLEILHNCNVSRYQQHLKSRLRKLKAFIEDESFDSDAPGCLKFFTSEYLYDPARLPKTGNPEPTKPHNFFDLCTEFYKLVQDIDKVKTTVIREAIEQVKKIRSDSLRTSDSLSYNDLLIKVRNSLTDSKYGEKLAEVLNQKYPAALIDEFQDTDPIQYSILDSVYPSDKADSVLLMIGDPKQAIYAFRGADVYTYLKAKSESSVKVYTLHKNFRSTAPFNTAVNTLFGYSDYSFLEEGIGYLDVDTGKEDLNSGFLIDGNPGSKIRIVTKPGVDTTKSDASEYVYNQTVKEIFSLLRKSHAGEVQIDGKNLQAGDIAVLVSSHKHAAEVKQRLKKAGIDSITYSREKVFESTEARRLGRLMEAVLNPYDVTAVNNMLISGFWGQDLGEIYELSVEGNERQALIEELQQLSEVWFRDGFYPMFRRFLFSGERISKLAKFENSERMLTNLYQLADVCVKTEKEGKLDPHSLFSWFADETADPGDDEERTLLLESDQNLVKITTVHNSKGLEFPVVFCPTLWDVKSRSGRTLLTEYHTGDGDPVIRFAQESNEQNEKAVVLSDFEKAAEEVRKYYVAVTRAKYLCVIPWAHHSDCLRSGLVLSLLGKQDVTEVITNSLKLRKKGNFTGAVIFELFQELKSRSAGSIELEVQSEDEVNELYIQDKWKPALNLQFTPYSGRRILDTQRQVESFSSLASHNTEPEEPDYDQIMESYLSSVRQRSANSNGQNIFYFPRGVTAGTAIHKVFEDKKFRLGSAATDDHTDLIEQVLNEYNIDLKWTKVIQKMVRNVVLADIPGLALAEVEERDQLREMEFYFSARQPSLTNILSIIRGDRSFQLSENQKKSFLTGFIDLVVRQNGRYYILDYKSNYLGDSVEDYSCKRLKEEIYSASYDLQYHLYTVALAKYLKSRTPGFNYETDFGGVAYLFIRGMEEGRGDGVWFHKPEVSVIQKLGNELGVKL